MTLPEYTLLRSSRRKTVALQVKEGQVIVRAPYSVDLQAITRIIANKSKWLQKKIVEQLQQESSAENAKTCTFQHGSNLYIDGEVVSLNIAFDRKADVILYDDELTVVISYHRKTQLDKQANSSQQLTKSLALQVKKQLEQWFKQNCQKYINTVLPKFIKKTNLVPSSIKIRQYKARWGSCNNRKELSFNYLLMMTPAWVVDYVIIHELCHLQHLNHSASFWALVQQHDPNFKEAKKWLKTHQTYLKWQVFN